MNWPKRSTSYSRNDQSLNMKRVLYLLLLTTFTAGAQELYVYTEPASNMPAHSLQAKLAATFMPSQAGEQNFRQRYVADAEAGINKNWMVHLGTSFSDINTNEFRWESVFLYTKYRFFSADELHKHFRMAVFSEAAFSRSPFRSDEVNLAGDKSGLQVGLIATQLWHKLALSGTVSHTQVLHRSRSSKSPSYLPSRVFQVMGYSLSAGYLLLPFEYTDYKQTNLNFYVECLAQQALGQRAYYIDLAPALQFIFNSNTKLNFGYRFEVGSDMDRMSRNSWLVSIDRTFLNAFKK